MAQAFVVANKHPLHSCSAAVCRAKVLCTFCKLHIHRCLLWQSERLPQSLGGYPTFVFVVTGSRLVVRCLAPKLTELALPYHFHPNRWYHVVITHTTGSALSSSFIRMFVNGNLEASSRFKYAKVIALPQTTAIAYGTALQHPQNAHQTKQSSEHCYKGRQKCVC